MGGNSYRIPLGDQAMNTMLRAGVIAAAAVLLSAAAARAADKDEIDKTVRRGTEALRKQQMTDGLWRYVQDMGMTSLAALTLLECDVPAEDKGIQKAAEVVRNGVVQEKQTYALALAILFLDRLGDPVDIALIESLTVRLLAGQTKEGG